MIFLHTICLTFHNTHMPQGDGALNTIWNLYSLQEALCGFLAGDLRDPAVRREARKTTQEFDALLAHADWRYMGGQDVYEELQNLSQEMHGTLLAVSRELRQAARTREAYEA